MNEKKLDLKDKKLITLLDFHARQSYAHLARELGLSKQGVEYKVKNLIKKKIIKGFYPVINVPKLGYLYCRLAIVLQNVSPEKEKEILDYLVHDDRFFWVFTTQGIYDFLAVMWAKSISDFTDAITDLLHKHGMHIKAKNESITTDVIHYQHRYLLKEKRTEEIHLRETKERVELDDLDRRILQILCDDARAPLVWIAKEAGTSPKLTSFRIKRMEKLGILLGYRPNIDHNTLGYTYYKLWINVRYEGIGEVNRLYAYVRENPIVLYVVKGIGFPEDLDVEIMIKSNSELFDFIKDLRQSFPKLIGEYRTFMFIDTKKVRYLPF
ncbi:MAG: AsnC family transcriptional regulator [Nanoarchaeota archaeon]